MIEWRLDIGSAQSTVGSCKNGGWVNAAGVMSAQMVLAAVIDPNLSEPSRPVLSIGLLNREHPHIPF